MLLFNMFRAVRMLLIGLILCFYPNIVCPTVPSGDINCVFVDTLLIINYNSPFYETIDFLKELYSPIFPNIVFYGSEEHPEVHVIHHHNGWWGYEVLKDAMMRYPDYQGYLCLQDDCFLNFWNLIRLDRNKVWFNPSYYHPKEHLININEMKASWAWWNLPCGRSAFIEAFNRIPLRFVEKAASQLGEGNVSIRLCDCIYVPHRLKDDYVELCSYFSDPPVFLEIAQPYILFCIEDHNNWEILNMFWAWPHERAMKEYGPHFDWVHPFKFSKRENREFIREKIRENFQ